MKKLSAIVLVLCVLFSLAACGGGEGGIGKKETLVGTWELYDEGASAPKAVYVFNEDMTGERTTVRNARTEKQSFTYTDDGSVLFISYQNKTTDTFNYSLEPGKLTLSDNIVCVKAAQ